MYTLYLAELAILSYILPNGVNVNAYQKLSVKDNKIIYLELKRHLHRQEITATGVTHPYTKNLMQS